MGKKTVVSCPALGIEDFNIDVSLVQTARDSDKRGYMTSPLMHKNAKGELEEACVADSTGKVAVPLVVLIVDNNKKSKGGDKKKRTIITAT